MGPSALLLALTSAVLAVLVSLTGLIAVMMGLAGNADKHVTRAPFLIRRLESERFSSFFFSFFAPQMNLSVFLSDHPMSKGFPGNIFASALMS